MRVIHNFRLSSILRWLLLVSSILHADLLRLDLAHAAPQLTRPSDDIRINWSAFADTYFAYNLNELPTRNRPYTTQALYSEEFALNLGYLDVKLEGSSVRSRVAAHYGSSVVSNYASEPELFWRYIQEANFGYQLGEGLWVDAGIFLSHIGLESWISRDNWTYTRSLIADYSPYYQAGAKMSYVFSERWDTSLHLLNGWQNISDDRDPALGTQVSYRPRDGTQFTYNTFIGNEEGQRFFNNFLFKQEISESLSFAASVDVGFQRRSIHNDTVSWHGWALIAQYRVLPDVRIAGRAERYADPHQVILQSFSDRHVSATGLSINCDIELTRSLLWRTEYRVLLSSNEVFPRDGRFSDSEGVLVTSIAYSWDG